MAYRVAQTAVVRDGKVVWIDRSELAKRTYVPDMEYRSLVRKGMCDWDLGEAAGKSDSLWEFVAESPREIEERRRRGDGVC